jgi:hypothetical protein
MLINTTNNENNGSTQIKISGCMLSIDGESDKQYKSNWDITSDDPFILSHSHLQRSTKSSETKRVIL